ncbi:hypothetical protein C922_01463 [Plasmodium inui San Antonio 1]|uniref:Uncharacterized protein n=1 Tax=Plasmodium inui San Antonio 1 TaxID=1237626 RepID=W7AQX1_9APIC|nr:hypothetical protein C922_01463 [Plasmodium inui San Antonio 1]EUD67851.1 hypothetical protein C922_01463 [Plasmodium inui San Antonio 1]
MDKKVTEYTDRLNELMKNLFKEKSEIRKMNAIISIYNEGSTEIKEEDENEKYQEYLKVYNDDIRPIVDDIRNKAYDHLKRSSCIHQCNAYLLNYARLLNKYIRSIVDTTDQSVLTVVKSINDYNSLDKLLEHAQKENINIEEDVYLLKLLGQEIKELNYLYVINRSLINHANKVLLYMKENGILFDTKEDKILKSTKELINNYCVFHHLMILNIPIKKIYEEKIKESNDLFSTITKKLKDEGDKLTDSVFSEEESNKILKSSEEIVQYAERILGENKKKRDFFKKYREIITKRRLEALQYDFSYQEEMKEEILNRAQLIYRIYNKVFHVNKNNHLKKLNEIAQYTDSIVKGNLLLEKISAISKEKNLVEQNKTALENPHERLISTKDDFIEIEIEVENPSMVEELKEKEEKLARYPE